MEYYKEMFNYKKIFVEGCLVVVIYGNIVSPFYVQEEDKNKLIKIPSEFLGLYITDTSSSAMVVSFPIIPNFL